MHGEDQAGNNDIPQAVVALLLDVAKALVAHEDKVVIEIVRQETGPVMILGVAPEDILKFVGKHERTGRSLRMILTAAGRKHSEKLRLEIREQR